MKSLSRILVAVALTFTIFTHTARAESAITFSPSLSLVLLDSRFTTLIESLRTQFAASRKVIKLDGANETSLSNGSMVISVPVSVAEYAGSMPQSWYYAGKIVAKLQFRPWAFDNAPRVEEISFKAIDEMQYAVF